MNRRIDERLPVLWRGKLVDENDNEYACEVRDISQAGALVTTSAQLETNAEVLLEIDGLDEFAGRVQWAGSGELGLMLIAGGSLSLKRFAEHSGASISTKPKEPESD